MRETLLTTGKHCSHGSGGDISALVHSSSWREDDSSASAAVAINGGSLDTGLDRERRGALCGS
jgi:hypothetical protein